jgi:hypothetical protein
MKEHMQRILKSISELEMPVRSSPPKKSVVAWLGSFIHPTNSHREPIKLKGSDTMVKKECPCLYATNVFIGSNWK